MYWVYEIHGLTGGVVDEVQVAPQPAAQTNDFDLGVTEMSVAVAMPNGGVWLGTSAWTAVVDGQENWLAVPVRAEAAGSVLDVVFAFCSGKHAGRPEEVALLENGVPVVVDAHPGIAGSTHIGNGYHVTVTNWKPNAVYTVRSTMSAGGGAGSSGVVLLHTSSP